MADPNPPWRLLKTPNPAEKSIAISVPQTEIIHVISQLDAFVEGSLLKNFPCLPDPALAQDDTFGLYKYADSNETDRHAMEYMFIRPKTPAQRLKPFHEYTIKQPYDWLPVITFIEFSIATGAPLSQNTQDPSGRQGTVIIPRWLVRRGYIHGQRVMTSIRIREFLSDVPYPDSLVPSDEPMGTEISWDLVGSHGGTGRCLHPEKTVPGQGQGGSYPVISSDDTPQVATETAQRDGQWFPATNALRWQDFTTNAVAFVNGQFHRIEATYFAPDMPKASELRS